MKILKAIGCLIAFFVFIAAATLCLLMWSLHIYADYPNQLKKEAELGNSVSQYVIAKDYAVEGGFFPLDKAEAIKWFTKSANQGNEDAQYELGEHYIKGDIVEENPAEAVKYFTLAANRGHKKAQYLLGQCLQIGYGTEKNLAEAVKWYTQAANQNDADAQYELAYCYEKALGVEKDLTEAVKWYTKASRNGHKTAHEALQRLVKPTDKTPEKTAGNQ